MRGVSTTDSYIQPSACRNVPLIRLAALDTFSPKGRRLCVRQIGICRADASTPQGTGSPSRGTVSPSRDVRAGRPGPYVRAYHSHLHGLNRYDEGPAPASRSPGCEMIQPRLRRRARSRSRSSSRRTQAARLIHSPSRPAGRSYRSRTRCVPGSSRRAIFLRLAV